MTRLTVRLAQGWPVRDARLDLQTYIFQVDQADTLGVDFSIAHTIILIAYVDDSSFYSSIVTIAIMAVLKAH